MVMDMPPPPAVKIDEFWPLAEARVVLAKSELSSIGKSSGAPHSLRNEGGV